MSNGIHEIDSNHLIDMFGWLILQGPRSVLAVVNQPLTAAAHKTVSVICHTAFKLSFKLSSVVGWCVNMVLLC